MIYMENPFKGPQPYKEGDAFHGRDQEILEIYKLLRNEPLSLLFARSGTGKTSLIRAGLIPTLKEGGNFFPIYIHLPEKIKGDAGPHALAEHVIKLCRQEMEKFGALKGECVFDYGKVSKHYSLFEFLHNLTVIEPAASGRTPDEEEKRQLKPALIFDQLEEIFTLSFDKEPLQFLLNEIKCLLNALIPDYLDESFSGEDDPYYLRLMNNLTSKHRHFRILFSFREEYLPNFESLKYVIPSIGFTNSRYRLEPFSTDTAEKVIESTAPKIAPFVARSVAANLAVRLNNNFEKVIVEPFLLSLVCQKTYEELIKDHTTLGVQGEERVKTLVQTAIENHIDDLYRKIDPQTQAFIEQKLITADNHRTPFNYNDAAKDPVLKADIDELISNPNYRLLNKEQVLETEHIEVLHDRLLPPLVQRRDQKAEKARRAAAEKLEKELRGKYEKRRKKLMAVLFGIIMLTLFFAITGLISAKQKRQADELRRSVQVLNDSLKRNNEVLLKKSDSLSFNTAALRETIEEKNEQNDLLSMEKDKVEKLQAYQLGLVKKLTKTNDALEIQGRYAISTNQRLTNSYDSIRTEKNKTYNLASILKSQSDSLIKSIKKADPLTALAIAHSNYHQIKRMGIPDTAIEDSYKKSLVNTFNNTSFFSEQSGPAVDYANVNFKNGFLVGIHPGGASHSLCLYRLKEPLRPCDTLLRFSGMKDREFDDFAKIEGLPETGPDGIVESGRIMSYGFSKEKEMFYAILDTDARLSLRTWRVADDKLVAGPKEMPIGTDFRFSGLSAYGSIRSWATRAICYYVIARGHWVHLVKVLLKRRKCEITSFDAETGTRSTYSFKMKSKEELVKEFIGNEAVVTYSPSHRNFYLYSLKGDPLVTFKSRENISPNHSSFEYRNDDSCIVYSELDVDEIQCRWKFFNRQGKPYDSLDLKGNDVPAAFYITGSKILAFTSDSEIISAERGKDRWSTSNFVTPLSFGARKGFSVTNDKRYLLFSNLTRIYMIDINDPRQYKRWDLPAPVRNTLVPSEEDGTIIALGDNSLYKAFYKLPDKGIKDDVELEALLHKKCFGDAWPVSKEKMAIYGLKADDD